jgi:membrane-associated protein
VLGAMAWIWSMLLIGFVLGRSIPGVERHIEKVILLVIFISLLPGLISWWRGRSTTPAPTRGPSDI